jgi:hypothetical protein
MPEVRQPKPWPMKWVALAIVLMIAIYTFLTLYFRKPGPPHRPYQEAVDRANTTRLLASGYQRIALAVERPAGPRRTDVVPAGRAAASAQAAVGGLPPELASALVEPPLLAETIATLEAGAETGANLPYRVQFSATLADRKRVIAEALLFRKGDTLTLVPVFERIAGGLQARWQETTGLLTVPAGTLPPGRYTATLVGARGSRTWTLTVR